MFKNIISSQVKNINIHSSDETTKESEGDDVFESPIIRSPGFNDSSNYELYSGMNTIPSIFDHVCKKFRNKDVYHYRNIKRTTIEIDHSTNRELVTTDFWPVKSLKYYEIEDMVKILTTGIKTFDVSLQFGSKKIGIFLDTSLHNILILLCLLRAGIVPIIGHPNHSMDDVCYIIDQSNLSMAIIPSSLVKDYDLFIAERCSCLKRLIIVGSNVGKSTSYESQYFEVKTLEEVLEMGRNRIIIPTYPKKNSIAVILYTQSTSDDHPKGVILSHENICNQLYILKKKLEIDTPSKDMFLSYLPLSNYFELSMHLLFLFTGSKIGFGSCNTLLSSSYRSSMGGGANGMGDLQCFKPTVFTGTPAIFKRIKKSILQDLDNSSLGLKRVMFDNMFNRKKWYLENDGHQLVDLLGENLVFGKYRGESFSGGEIRLFISSGSSLSPQTHSFLQIVLGSSKCRVAQAYGLTETSGCLFITDCSSKEKNPKFSSCTLGNLFGHSAEVKIVCNVKPEIPYNRTKKTKIGELFIRSPSLFQGYYKNPNVTRSSFNRDNFFKTGDIVSYNEDTKVIRFLDQRKNMVQLSNGRYICPSTLETIYSISQFVESICVAGNPFKGFVVALVMINPSHVRDWARERPKLRGKDMSSLIKEKELKLTILENFKSLASEYQVKRWEYIKDVIILNDRWTPENGLLTPFSHKIRRKNMYQRYKVELVEIFRKHV